MHTDTQEREWLSVKEVAFELGLHPTAVYRAIDNGCLPVLRLHSAGAIRIHRSALDPHTSKEAA
jgi:excisionase family DNA binding protein